MCLTTSIAFIVNCIGCNASLWHAYSKVPFSAGYAARDPRHCAMTRGASEKRSKDVSPDFDLEGFF